MRGRWLLAVSVLAAVLVTAATTAVLLLVEPKLSKAEAVKTGGLAGGSVVALYALWLNDRRRRTEEARHELESDKVADERFARAVELLGDEADQVRVGALHALASLARTTPRYKQTVLDVLCAYLRRPFSHPSYAKEAADPARSDGEHVGEEDRERQVRLTAQRLIADLLPWGRDPDPNRYHLDLTGASVEYLRLEGRRVGRLVARRTRFYGITAFAEVDLSKPALFTGARFHGRVALREGRFTGGISFESAEFHHEVDFSGAEVGAFLDLNTAPPERRVGELAVLPGTNVKGPKTGWALITR
ncbi:hypothetical protein JOF41_005868 [Saccharothrix coeruleofusca]|uniref:pentapeptide repeat-containing protein n=1 Tax=Saccharothrix coeruleofusca TaxID=33919 RepID=UPI001AE9C6FA|nr:pentapeptide repeat-containing protein [Saccharothrix coeruleofusca]MBP2339690.1 hypothetical protein [Saccharothrix coeruleofusca]